jgi:predicted  nucleic acid-binding Zn-ribbon protein
MADFRTGGFMSTKVKKLEAEIERAKAKITELQNRMKELGQQKIVLENTEIVAAFRNANIAPEDLPAVIAAFRKNTYGTVRLEEKRIEKE